MALDTRRFIQRFIEEAADHLPRLRDGIHALAQRNASHEQIDELFRAAHTVKGSSRMLKLTPITALAHSTEELLSALRDGTQAPDDEVIRLLNQAVDALEDNVSRLAAGATPDTLPQADADLCQALEQAAQPGPGSASLKPEPPALDITPSDAAAPASPTPDTAPQAASSPISSSIPPPTTLRLSDTVRVRLERLDDVIRLMGEVLSGHQHMHSLVEEARRLTHSLPREHPAHAFRRELKESVQAHDTLMSDLHERALQMRMLPLNVVFDPLAHMARELARTLNKQVICEVSGSDIELDRQMIDRLSDPLIHLLRNALDHGLETPDERKAAGKPAQGRITLRAFQDGNWVVVEMRDDGRGIALDVIRQKALSKQLVTTEQLETLSEQETLELIFLPGFSTKTLITDFSGRGVGMDVVKRTVTDELSGSLQVTTDRGQGSCFTLRMPLSLAMLRVLLVRAGTLTVGITAAHVVEIVERKATDFIEAAGRLTLILRNEFVPVVPLAALLGGHDVPSPISAQQPVMLMVVRQGQHKLALQVETLIDERERIIKPLPTHLRRLPLVVGMVSFGRNALVSLLHVPALMAQARRDAASTISPATPPRNAHRVLVVDDSLNTREIEKDVLEAWGYHVTLAENGRDGLNKALAEPFDAVLTDVEMPVMDGFALTAELRENDAYRHRPIIIITSREKEADRRRGIDVGADAYIVKGSFDQNNLVETLKALLG
ncbi:hybrid sensor histidine kinase/response regulator [Vreelandella salicampi]|uniref:Chemotaxis protein CheA n=1 Tax=Vreelandella salicampi TaxID=1449798 RepID=A0A7Z0RVN9_9GAMM|nr:hybrid sensor histidine kinase/response regulator [Halomonas salicampi]NYS61807.1 hybrid sensor histidine kinase/response regulator [Halomonas salicampi]